MNIEQNERLETLSRKAYLTKEEMLEKKVTNPTTRRYEQYVAAGILEASQRKISSLSEDVIDTTRAAILAPQTRASIRKTIQHTETLLTDHLRSGSIDHVNPLLRLQGDIVRRG